MNSFCVSHREVNRPPLPKADDRIPRRQLNAVDHRTTPVDDIEDRPTGRRFRRVRANPEIAVSVGALHVVTENADEATRVLSQVKRVIRTNYSNPPSHGPQTVAMVLTTTDMRAQWDGELAEMRDRIKLMRRGLVERIRAQRADFDFSFVVNQRGLFSYSGLNKDQVQRLREDNAKAIARIIGCDVRSRWV